MIISSEMKEAIFVVWIKRKTEKKNSYVFCSLSTEWRFSVWGEKEKKDLNSSMNEIFQSYCQLLCKLSCVSITKTFFKFVRHFYRSHYLRCSKASTDDECWRRSVFYNVFISAKLHSLHPHGISLFFPIFLFTLLAPMLWSFTREHERLNFYRHEASFHLEEFGDDNASVRVKLRVICPTTTHDEPLSAVIAIASISTYRDSQNTKHKTVILDDDEQRCQRRGVGCGGMDE